MSETVFRLPTVYREVPSITTDGTGWATPGHVNAVAAYLVSRCGCPVETAGARARELIDLASEAPIR